jgi:hypothetical protein
MSGRVLVRDPTVHPQPRLRTALELAIVLLLIIYLAGRGLVSMAATAQAFARPDLLLLLAFACLAPQSLVCAGRWLLLAPRSAKRDGVRTMPPRCTAPLEVPQCFPVLLPASRPSPPHAAFQPVTFLRLRPSYASTSWPVAAGSLRRSACLSSHVRQPASSANATAQQLETPY